MIGGSRDTNCKRQGRIHEGPNFASAERIEWREERKLKKLGEAEREDGSTSNSNVGYEQGAEAGGAGGR